MNNLTFLRKVKSNLGDKFRLYFSWPMSDEEFFKKIDWNYPGLKRSKDDEKSLRIHLIHYMQKRAIPILPLKKDKKEETLAIIGETFPESKKKIIESADKICERSFCFLGSDIVKFSKDINWHYNFALENSWPRRYAKDIDCRGPERIGDVKLTWELNRHQYFIDLGKAYWCTGDEKYAEEVTYQILSWLRQNPPGIGVNWDNGLEVALRSISWIWGLHFFRESEYFTQYGMIPLFKGLYQNAEFIYKNLSLKEYNHLIGEATGLALIGMLFPEFREAEMWKEMGLKILTDEIDRQIYPDGVNVEQSLAYHRFVLDFYLLTMIVAKMNGIEIFDKVKARVEKMLEFLMYSARPDKSFPMIGDSDDGKVLPIGSPVSNLFQISLAIGAVYYNRADFKFMGEKAREAILWLFGPETFKEYQKMDAKPPSEKTKIFKEGGYFIMRTGWDREDKYMIFDFGNQGVGNSPHGHSDSLSFELFALGRTIISDSGTFTYNGPREWRNYFKGTSAHNTIVINEMDQATIKGTFRWSNKPDVFFHRFISENKYDFIEASHNGYCRLQKPVKHRRKILFVKPSFWVIKDILIGEGNHKCESFFHLKEGEIKLMEGSNIAKISVKKGTFWIIPFNPPDTKVHIQESWISEGYAKKRKNLTLNFSQNTLLPTFFIYLFYPGELKSSASVEKMQEVAKEKWFEYIGENLL